MILGFSCPTISAAKFSEIPACSNSVTTVFLKLWNTYLLSNPNWFLSLPNLLPESTKTDVSLFLDFGNVWGTDYRSPFDDSNFLRGSTGAGVEWFTPVGPVSLTFSHALFKKTTDEFEGFQFNIGTTF